LRIPKELPTWMSDRALHLQRAMSPYQQQDCPSPASAPLRVLRIFLDGKTKLLRTRVRYATQRHKSTAKMELNVPFSPLSETHRDDAHDTAEVQVLDRPGPRRNHATAISGSGSV